MSHHNEKVPIIEPDLKFAQEVMGMGGEDLQRCYQCATCTVVCPISPEDSPFPRREMLWAQWGLKDKLMKDPNIFLCHQCGDCSAYCPRDAKPGDVFGALRNYAYRFYAVPRFMGTALSDPKYLFLLILFPVILLAGIMGILASGVPADIVGGILPQSLEHLVEEFHIQIFPKGEIVFAHMYPHLGMIDPLFITTTLLVFISFAISIKKFWSAMDEGQPKTKLVPIGQAVMETLTEFLAHRKFDECGEKQDRSTPHKLLFYSFVALAVVTAFVAGGFWVFDVLLPLVGVEEGTVANPFLSPLSIINPVKIVGLIAGAVLVVGIVMILNMRMNPKDDKTKTSYSDWFLIGTILTVAVSGCLSWIFRIMNIGVLAYSVYFIHLVSVFCLIGYFPFSKFAHLVYRFVAIVYVKHSGRDVKLA